MKQKVPIFARKSDYLIIGLLLAASLLCWFIPFRHQGNIAQIRLNGIVIAELSLSKPQEALTIDDADGYIFHIEQGKISVTAAPCQGQVCVHSAPISAVGQQIICLPNHLTITILGDSDPDTPDAVL